MTKLLLSSLIFAIVIQSSSIVSILSAHESGRVILLVTDTFGVQFLDSFDIEVRRIADNQVVRSETGLKSGEAIELPYGSYSLLVTRAGFEETTSSLTIDRARTAVVIGLVVGNLVGFEPLGSIVGTITSGDAENQFVWTKLVGLYSDYMSYSLADSNGRFSFTGLRAGRYLLLTFLESKLTDKREIVVRKDEKILIEWP